MHDAPSLTDGRGRLAGRFAGWLGWVGQSNVEIQIKRVYAVSRATVFLPFSVEDAARSEAEVEASQVSYSTSTKLR